MKTPPIRCSILFSTVLLAVLSTGPAVAAPAPRPWPPHPFAPLTIERIAALPAADQPAWRAYLDASTARARLLPPRSSPDFSPLQPLPGLPKGGIHTKGLRLNERAPWYASDAARVIADRVVAAQSPTGAWTKGNDYTGKSVSQNHGPHDLWSSGTFDNDATIRELQFLARVATAAGNIPRAAFWRDAFLRGLDYCFAAQYPNGGFPQVYPLGGGYHDAITFNDDAMTNVLELLRDVAKGHRDYKFVPAAQRDEAAKRFARGIDCILATQLKTTSGELTVWCQQYDALTLAPCAARNFEPTSECAAESARLVELLLSIPQPSPAIVTAIDAGVAWFKRVALHDVVWDRAKTDGSGLVPTPGAPLLWARFYELDTHVPIFGDRDRTIHYNVTELSPERRLGYSWYGNWPEHALEVYNAWHGRIAAQH